MRGLAFLFFFVWFFFPPLAIGMANLPELAHPLKIIIIIIITLHASGGSSFWIQCLALHDARTKCHVAPCCLLSAKHAPSDALAAADVALADACFLRPH